MGILRLFLCKFSLRWGALPPHSLVPVLPYLFPGGYCFFRPKAFVSTTCSVFRRTEPTARADVVSWADESRECAWTFTSFSSVNSPSAGKLCRFIRWPPPAPRVRGQMSPRRPTNPTNARGHSQAFPLSILPPLKGFDAPFTGLRPRRGFAGGGYLVGLRIPRMYVCKFLNFPAWVLAPAIKLCLPLVLPSRPFRQGASKLFSGVFMGITEVSRRFASAVCR